MPEFSKKRRASTSDDSDVGASHKAAKKSKNRASAAPAGKDDEGNPYWEVNMTYNCYYLVEIRSQPLVSCSYPVNAASGCPSSKTCA